MLSAVSGATPLRKLFTKEQRAFFKAHAPDGIDARRPDACSARRSCSRTCSSHRNSKRRFVAEVWLYPDGSRILELSTKCLPPEAFQVAAESRSYLAGKGVNLSGAQQTKTRTALRYFQGELKRTAPARRKATTRTTSATPGADDDASSGGDHDQGIGCQAGDLGERHRPRRHRPRRATKAKTTTRAPRKTAAKPA